MSSGGEGEIVINVSTPDGVPVGALSGIGLTNGPEFDLSERVETNYIAPRPRKYRINQNKVVKEIMGEEALAGVGQG